MKKFLCTLCAGVAFSCLGLSVAEAWSLEEAAKDYKGTEIKVIFLDRPGYRATIKMLPEFEQKTGIKVSYEIVPYESTREKEVLDFSAQGDLSLSPSSTSSGWANLRSPAGLFRSTICRKNFRISPIRIST